MIIILESIQEYSPYFFEHLWTHIELSRQFLVQAFCLSTFHYGYWIMTDNFGKNIQVTVKVGIQKVFTTLMLVLQRSGFGIRAQKMRLLCVF